VSLASLLELRAAAVVARVTVPEVSGSKLASLVYLGTAKHSQCIGCLQLVCSGSGMRDGSLPCHG
jgi:hypothetical protein